MDDIHAQQKLSSQISDGADAQLVHQVVGNQLDAQSDAIVKGIYRKLSGSEVLSGDEAIQAWMELHTIHRLREKLTGKERAGISAAGKLDRELQTAPVREARARSRQKFPRT